MRAPGRLWEVRDPSSSLSLAFLPPLSPPLPLLLLPPPSLDRAAGCRREGQDEDGEAPRKRRGCAEGGCRAAQRRAPGRGCGPRGLRPTPSPRLRGLGPLNRQDGQVLRVTSGLACSRRPGDGAGPELANLDGGERELGAGLRGVRPCRYDHSDV